MRATRASLGRSWETDAIRKRSLAAPSGRCYQPNDYRRGAATALSPRGDVRTGCGDCFFTFETRNCASAAGEPNCALMSHVAAAIATLAMPPTLAAFFSCGDIEARWAWRRCMPLAARKPSTAAPPSTQGEVRVLSAACALWRA